MSAYVKLDNKTKRYRSGERITGTIEVTIGKGSNVKKITVELFTLSFCLLKKRWVKFGYRRDKYVTTFKANKEHFYRLVYVGGYDEQLFLKKGFYDFRFAVELPVDLPPSFQGKYGCTIYLIKANIDILESPLSFTDIFYVTPVLDLNRIPACRKPTSLTLDKKLFCFVLRLGKITAKVRTPKSGYVPGEIIPFSIEIKNKLGVQLADIRISLVKKVTFKFFKPSVRTKTEQNVIQTGQLDCLLREWKGEGLGVYLRVPCTEPTTVGKDDIILIEYFVDIVCKFQCFAEIRRQRAIIIGTVPVNK